ncbi:uncharacterized protein LOC114969902 [Acropora millepora]|uniref:uncharacterized protein LOC114969902 n=1 Tax=Acropora millepora TaxID=45264 RepID=UPI001CF47C3F|nr:uncharacterized protein LOC114969902 [Acropora millepora]
MMAAGGASHDSELTCFEKMALNLKNREFIFNLFAQSLSLWFCIGPVKSNPLPSSLSCNPRDGKIGTAESIIVQIDRFDDTSVNFRRDKPRLLSTLHRTISNNGKIYFLDFNLKAKFHGREVCLSTLKETILNQKGADERKIYTCEHVCLEVGNAGSLVTNSSSGGKLWPGKRCCVWNRNRFYMLATMNEGPKCLSCLGSKCLKENGTTKQCRPGDKCVAISLKQKQNKTKKNSSVVPIMLGCSSDHSLRGYTCNDGCKREVNLVGSGTSTVCVRCCTGNKCNGVGGETPKNSTQTVQLKEKVDNPVQLNGVHPLKRNVNLTIIFSMTFLAFSKRMDF